MKKYILALLLGVGIWSCYQEDDIHVAEQVYRRTYDTTTTDPVLKYVSRYYFDCGRVFIVDPDTADYVYNLQNKNEYRLVRLPQDEEYLMKAIELTEELFLNAYSVDARKKCFPFSVIIADSIWDETGYTIAISQSTVMSGSLFAIALPASMFELTEAEKEDRSREIHLAFLKGSINQGRIEVPYEFYASTRQLYGEEVDLDGGYLSQEKVYELGFVYIDDWWMEYPMSYVEDAGYFIEFLLETPQEEIDEIRATYPLLKERLDVIVSMLESYGIDYKNLGYKAKE